MTISDASWSAKFRLIGELERPDHYYLTDADQCAFWGEYTSHAGYSHSTTNQIIFNLKKKPSTRHTPQWAYKEQEIERVAKAMKAAINPAALPNLCFVPIPPSKLPSAPEYDDRMLRIARLISPHGARELIRAVTSRPASHSGDNKRDPQKRRDASRPTPNSHLPH